MEQHEPSHEPVSPEFIEALPTRLGVQGIARGEQVTGIQAQAEAPVVAGGVEELGRGTVDTL